MVIFVYELKMQRYTLKFKTIIIVQMYSRLGT